jgi:hypothetical protein
MSDNLSPNAKRLLAWLAEGYIVEGDDGRYQLFKPAKLEGDAANLPGAAFELFEAGLVDRAVNGSGTCWINDKGRAAVSVRKVADREVAAYCAGVIGVVEANSFEQLSLWHQNSQRDTPKTWDSAPRGGPLVTIGHVAGMPVCIALSKVQVGGRVILFMDATSQVVDHRMIKEWLEVNMPASARREGGAVNLVDAMNFNNVFPQAPWVAPPRKTWWLIGTPKEDGFYAAYVPDFGTRARQRAPMDT